MLTGGGLAVPGVSQLRKARPITSRRRVLAEHEFGRGPGAAGLAGAAGYRFSARGNAGRGGRPAPGGPAAVRDLPAMFRDLRHRRVREPMFQTEGRPR
jgi:hypothetical protein